MVVGDIIKEINLGLQSIGLGRGVYKISYPAYYYDASPVTLIVKLEADTEVVLERDEEVENMALLSTSDEYTIMDNGSVMEKFGNIEGIEQIIEASCNRHHVKFANNQLSLEADTETTLSKINRYIKCIFEIESKVLDKVGELPQKEETHTSGASEKLMEYLNKKVN